MAYQYKVNFANLLDEILTRYYQNSWKSTYFRTAKIGGTVSYKTLHEWTNSEKEGLPRLGHFDKFLEQTRLSIPDKQMLSAALATAWNERNGKSTKSASGLDPIVNRIYQLLEAKQWPDAAKLFLDISEPLYAQGDWKQALPLYSQMVIYGQIENDHEVLLACLHRPIDIYH